MNHALPEQDALGSIRSLPRRRSIAVVAIVGRYLPNPS